jgi:hypothetical protein
MLSPAESLDFYRELALTHACEGGPVGERIASLIRRDRLRDLCEFEVDYSVFEVPDHVYHCRQALAFFQKLEPLDIGIDREAVAMRKFLESEELCRESNRILRLVREGSFQFRPRVAAVLFAAQRKISRVLGRCPSLGELPLRFGPGATRATRRKESSIRRKIAERIQCSEELFQMVPYLLEELPHIANIHSVQDRTDEDGVEWCRVPVEYTPAKLSFVPKNAKTYRSVCTEPGLNVLIQLGIGDFMTRRLARFGIDISDQTLNQRRALEGSLTGALATLDLSSASDTISRELVYDLLPLDWAVLLDRTRSRKVLLPDGSCLSQEKLSSMGNGYTFPLETLIFWSLAASCCHSDSEATVYGDDIIVPVEAYDLLTEVLQAVGFLVNRAKSYHTGLFRESCGKDYYSGIDVRPIYAKDWVSAQSLFVLRNFYWRRGDLVRSKYVESKIHEGLRIYGPDGFGDGVLVSDDFERRRPKNNRGFSGYFFDIFVTRSSQDQVSAGPAEYVVPLYSIYRRSADEYFPDLSSRDLIPGSLSIGKLTFLAKFSRGVGSRHTLGNPLPETEKGTKRLSLPEVSGYRKISVYTLRD